MKPRVCIATLMIFSPASFADASLVTREVLLQNERVEVVRLTYPVGSESGMHTHDYPNRVAYIVEGGTLELIPADGQKASQVIRAVKGDTAFLPAATHNVRNIGTTEIVIIETELK